MKTIITTLLFFLSLSVSANYFEFFGTHVTTSGIGNQANLNHNDPANNYYIPAQMAFTETFNLSTSISSAVTDFEPINGVVIKNDSFQDPALNEEVGSVSTSYQKYYSGSLHLALPLAKKLGTIGLSISAPIGSLIETNSGNAFLPEYVMYRSRYRRTIALLNYAKNFGEAWAFSIGTQIGFQAAATADTNVSIQSDYGSYGSMKSKVKPSLGLIFSTIYKPADDFQLYFSYQQEMKNNLEANAFGKVSISTTTDYILDLNITSMIFYDPHIFRLGTGTQLGMVKLYGSVEYQMWGNYKTPLMKVAKRGGGIQPSSDYEVLKTKDIFIPKLGMGLVLTESIELDLGIAYKPTPIDGDFSGAGNSLDTDSTILTGAALYKTKFFEIPLQLGGSLQYHMLEDKTVSKTAGLENGDPGNKIGAPGYKIGGSVLVGSLGLTLNY
ncbi:hypothetical protein [Halobacteriovorax sp. JY17]|uniref:OmpP1/FadL family transporter n=1 Tax=Halobacteriovorax sp. JY17 TaxID=2014617 RepID=UPI000C5226BF|nr:hypothetical protein [Halobacteriovorax sp. JY17]PIK15065.1 MAG: hypothetical protein CES88_12075 [Halobacteriovorax sp. JY17]